MGIPEKIKKIEDDIHRTQINKKTEHHIGLLKAKLAKLRREQEEQNQEEVVVQLGTTSKRQGMRPWSLLDFPVWANQPC